MTLLQIDILLCNTEGTAAICVSVPAFHVYLIALLRFLNTTGVFVLLFVFF